jgi:putative peptidoglycan lipid II flippase
MPTPTKKKSTPKKSTARKTGASKTSSAVLTADTKRPAPPTQPQSPAEKGPGRFSFTRQHTAASAAMLLMASSLLSGLLALIRIGYVNAIFGPGIEQDAYRAAFKLPDLLNYFLIGGAASISLITILNRYREAGDEEGGDRALSVILTTMLVVLGGGVLLCMSIAPLYVRYFVDGFQNDARGPLCVSMIRLLLPAQLFFFIGSVMSSRLQVRKIFLYQAFTPLIYNVCIILGAVFLHRQFHIYSLIIGVLAGVILGSALLNSLGAFRTGLRYRPIINFRDPAFLEWFHLSLPLMLGVSLVMFDGIFLNKFASRGLGGVTHFNVIGPAAGAASLPFFASLYQQGRAYDFSDSVGRSVSRLFCVGLLVSAWMLALAPWLMDLFRRGRFNRADTATTTQLFLIFAITLGVWAAQGIYARAFYAASDTRTPAIAGTAIVILSIPLYWGMFRAFGLVGLALASDIGILAQTVSLAILLHKKRLVSLLHLEFAEIGRSTLAATVAFAVTYAATHALRLPTTHEADALIIATGSVVWAAVTYVLLVATGSKLPAQLLRRKH